MALIHLGIFFKRMSSVSVKKMETILDSREIKIIGNVPTESQCDGNETITKTREISVTIHHLSTCHFIREFSHNFIHADLCSEYAVILITTSFSLPCLRNDRESSVLLLLILIYEKENVTMKAECVGA